MSTSAIQRSIVFTKPQMDFLMKEAKRLGITVADVVRRIIDQHRDQISDR